MSFYSDFAEHYESVFPFERETYAFLAKEAGEGGVGRRVLDVGCGTGDYCGRFAHQGFSAVGIDLDPWMISRAIARYPRCEFHVMDMSEIGALGNGFAMGYCIGNVASHLSQAALTGFLQAVLRLLEDEAAWVVQTVNWDFFLQKREYAFPDIQVGGTDVVFERRYPRITEREVLFKTRLRSGDQTLFQGSTTLYPVRSPEYIKAHEAAGFELRGHYADFVRAPFDPGVPSSSVLTFSKRRSTGR